VSLARALQPDILIVELTIAQTSELGSVWQLATPPSPIRIVILGTDIDGEIVRSLRLGVRAFVRKRQINTELADSLHTGVVDGWWAGHARATTKREAIAQMRLCVERHSRRNRSKLTVRSAEPCATFV
jgi:DNA-binding NarL/FixJ family response regulator